MTEELAEDFWRTSLALYARPGVADACLSLQDRRDADVNVLLLCCWAGRRGITLTAAMLREAVVAAGPWQASAVRPLRAARRAMKGWGGPHAAEVEALRAALKASELEAERLEQRMLAAAVRIGPGGPGGAAVRLNLEAYVASLELDLDEQDRQALDALAAAASAGP